MSYTAGQKVRVGDLLPGTIVQGGYGLRTSSSTAAAGAQGVMRLDGILLTAGRRYKIFTNTLVLVSSVANDQVTARISYDVTGANATTASALLALYNTPAVDSTANGMGGVVAASYLAAANVSLSIILWTQRLVGTGNARLISAGVGIEMFVKDMGVDTGDTGVDL